jgi:hypothetical protein
MTRYTTICLAALLAGVLSFTAAGCSNLHLFPPHNDKERTPEQTIAAAPVPPKPGKYSLRVAPYVFLSDLDIKPDMPLFKELAGLRDQVYKELRLPSAERPVYVYLFEDRDRYQKYMQARYPKLPKRRAFFIAQPRAMGGEDLLVFTSWGEPDRIRQDLRHELTHALLHSVLKDVPLWLDEGLAEYFELPPERAGVNDAHLAHIRRTSGEVFQPNLARLEGLEEVQQMTPAEYREAWAWVHLMLRGRPEVRPVLLAYLQQLRTNSTPGPLRSRLAEVLAAPEESLSHYMSCLDLPPEPVPTAQRYRPANPQQ